MANGDAPASHHQYSQHSTILLYIHRTIIPFVQQSGLPAFLLRQGESSVIDIYIYIYTFIVIKMINRFLGFGSYSDDEEDEGPLSGNVVVLDDHDDYDDEGEDGVARAATTPSTPAGRAATIATPTTTGAVVHRPSSETPSSTTTTSPAAAAAASSSEDNENRVVVDFAPLHEDACLRLGRLYASPREVYRQNSELCVASPSYPRDNGGGRLLLWKTTFEDENDGEEKFANELHRRMSSSSSRGGAGPSSSSSAAAASVLTSTPIKYLLSPVKAVLSSPILMSPFSTAAYDGSSDDDDGTSEAAGAGTVVVPGDRDPIVCVELARNAARFMSRAVEERIRRCRDAGGGGLASATGDDRPQRVWRIDDRGLFDDEDNSNNNNDLRNLLKRMPADQVRVLWKVLERQGAVECQKESGLVVALEPPGSSSCSSTTRMPREEYVRYHVAMYNLRDALLKHQKLETQFGEKAEELGREALKASRRGDKKLAVSMMRRRKLYTKKAEHQSGCLHNVENAMFLLEQAVENRDVINALSQANDTLKQMRTDNNIDRVDDLMDDLAEEFDTLETQNQQFADMAQFGTSGIDLSEEELLGELESLVVEDSENEALTKELESMTLDGTNGEEVQNQQQSSTTSPTATSTNTVQPSSLVESSSNVENAAATATDAVEAAAPPEPAMAPPRPILEGESPESSPTLLLETNAHEGGTATASRSWWGLKRNNKENETELSS